MESRQVAWLQMKSSSIKVAALLLTVAIGSVQTIANEQAKQVKTEPPVRGLVHPRHQAAIATDLQARVLDVRFREGESFRKGDVLISFDCERQRAEFESSAAQNREMKAAFDGAAYLEKKGALGRLDLEVARAKLDRTAADVAGLSAKLNLCIIAAPFDGRISERFVNAYEFPAPGKPLLNILDETSFDIEMIVPSQWLQWISIGSPITFAVDELNQAYEAKVSRLGAAVDPVSQTIKIYAVFSGKPERVLAGMSGNIHFVSEPR